MHTGAAWTMTVWMIDRWLIAVLTVIGILALLAAFLAYVD